jgi:hypothetical protein
MFSQLCEHLYEVWDQIAGLFRLDHDVIDVRLDDSSYEIYKDTSHALLECGAHVFELEGHRLVAIGRTE